MGCDHDRKTMAQAIFISIHAPRVGCDEDCIKGLFDADVFQSTHPVWGATMLAQTACTATRISIHAPRVGCDPAGSNGYQRYGHFNPRTPCGVRRHKIGDRPGGNAISIHAPRVGCDHLVYHMVILHRTISIHAPRVGCDLLIITIPALSAGFQSTHPVWGATSIPRTRPQIWRNFNPRTPCGVRLVTMYYKDDCIDISIHAPRVGCDSS